MVTAVPTTKFSVWNQCGIVLMVALLTSDLSARDCSQACRHCEMRIPDDEESKTGPTPCGLLAHALASQVTTVDDVVLSLHRTNEPSEVVSLLTTLLNMARSTADDRRNEDKEVSAIRRHLGHQAPEVRRAACIVLRQYGTKARAALSPLVKCLTDSEYIVSREALYTLCQTTTIEEIVRELGSHADSIRDGRIMSSLVARAYESHSETATTMVGNPTVLRLLDDPRCATDTVLFEMVRDDETIPSRIKTQLLEAEELPAATIVQLGLRKRLTELQTRRAESVGFKHDYLSRCIMALGGPPELPVTVVRQDSNLDDPRLRGSFKVDGGRSSAAHLGLFITLITGDVVNHGGKPPESLDIRFGGKGGRSPRNGLSGYDPDTGRFYCFVTRKALYESERDADRAERPGRLRHTA